MKILIVSHTFPPYNSIGTLRVGKTAKYLTRLGHDIRVLTASPHPYDRCLPIEVDPDRVCTTRWVNLYAPAEHVSRIGPGTGLQSNGWRGRFDHLLRSTVWRLYKELVGFPDLLVGWVPFAVREGVRLVGQFQPDVILSSSPPSSTHIAASLIAQWTGVPWVAELRDLWTDTHDYPHSRTRWRLERRIERAVLGTASGIVTVSDGLAATLQAHYSVPVAIVRNGFDPEDLPARPPVDPSDLFLRIVYTGSAHPRYQPPDLLFKAISHSPLLRERVRVEFFGRRQLHIAAAAALHDVSANVAIRGPVSYSESLGLQLSADLLLLLLWKDPEQPGVMTGKIYEYLGARRPVLAIGAYDDEAAGLIRTRGAGTVAGTVAEVQRALSTYLEMKADGALPHLPASISQDFTRAAQTLKLSEFFTSVLENHPRSMA